MLALYAAQVLLFSAFPLYFSTLSNPVRQVCFYVWLGLVLLFGGYLGSVYTLPLAEGVAISGGNLCYGAFMMSSVLFVIVERDIFILRNIVRLVISVDVFNFFLSWLVSSSLQHEGVINSNNTPVQLFDVSAPLIVLGGVLIIAELLFLLFAFEKLKRLTSSLYISALAYTLLFSLALCADGILFPLIGFGMSQMVIDMVIGNLGGKVLLALSFSLPLLLFLCINRSAFSRYLNHAPFRWGLLVMSSERLMQDMQRNETRLQQAAVSFDHASEGVFITDSQLRLTRANPAFLAMLGITEAQVEQGQQTVTQLIQLGDAGRGLSQAQGFSREEVRYGQRDGSHRAGLLSLTPLRDNAGVVHSYVGALVDIQPIKHVQQQLAYLAEHDTLTGLANRRLLEEALQDKSARAREALLQHGEVPRFALLTVDLDHFKDVNDSYGHPAGDEVLVEVAQRLLQLRRHGDLLCRTGGDEFAVLMRGLDDIGQAGQMAEAILHSLQAPLWLSNHVQVHISASIGIAVFPDQTQDISLLLQQADTALYAAKHRQRGTFAYFVPQMTELALNKLTIESRLREAMAQDHLQVYFQPQVQLADNQICGAEALVRWIDPQHGIVSPAEFIPVAEVTGLIEELGATVLRKSCQQGRQWLDAGFAPMLISVNISPHQLRFGNLVRTVQHILDETGYPPQWLELELTESALIERENEVLPQLQALVAMGIHLALDDFGTGYSSLSYLSRFPIDTLKIDKSFLDGVPDSARLTELTATIIAMGRNLGLRVIAEGVETEVQREFLAERDCHLYQGYLKSPPVPAERFAALRRAG